MERFVKGDVIAVNFSFSDLTQNKRRPALVLLSLEGEDIILAEITTKIRNSTGDIELSEKDFEKGKFKHTSVIRLTKIFTIKRSLISYKIGSLKKEKIQEVVNTLCDLFKK